MINRAAGIRQCSNRNPVPGAVGLLCCLILFLIFTPDQQGIAQSTQVETPRLSRTLDFYIRAALENAPALHDLDRQRTITALQKEVDAARVSGTHAWLSSEYLFAPFFSNSGLLVSTNPPPGAVGYDVGITNGGQYSAQLHVERSIFSGTLTDALSRQNDVKLRSLQHDYAFEERRMRKEVTELYLQTYRLQLLRAMSQDVADNLRSELAVLGSLQRKGLSRSKDFLLLKIEFEAQQIELRNAEQALRGTLRRLTTSCGLPSDTVPVDLQPVTLAVADSGDGTGFLQGFVLDSLAITAEQEVVDASYHPQVRLFANTGLNAVELHDIQQKFGFSAGFSLTLPLYDGGQKQRKQEQAVLALKSLDEYRRRSRLNIQSERATARDRLETLRSGLQSMESQLADFGTIMEVSRRQLSAGGISMTEYLILVRRRIDMLTRQIDLRISMQQQINTLNYWSWQNERQH
ncbi:TolC family protein [bacterium]|nr:TolC family protein [bacterium]